MSRLDKTLADYVAIAISPALIMLMVGSLMWFLVAVFYQGNFGGRIYWILACFVFAIVLIARIGIEQGQERATLFGVPLALAVGLATMQFSDAMFFHWILLAVAWWAAHKLTWDCTLIDEEQDSSGQGLLQIIRFGRKPPDAKDESGETEAEKKEDEPDEPEGVTERVGRMREEAHPKRQTKGKAHAPGVWIVYFSLAALPLFGLGQMLVPVSDGATRLWTFQLLCTYVAAGLGLLVTTSFVGLRRYLRQRGVQMPPQMAGVWIALGAAIIVGLLAVCAILPRPAAEYEVARMPDFPLKFTTPERESNRYAMGKEGADKNNPDSQSRTQGKQDGTKPEGGKSDQPESGGKEGSKAKQGSGNQKGSDGKSQSSSKGEKQGQSESKQNSSQQQSDASQRQDSQSNSQSNQQQRDSRRQPSGQNDSNQRQSQDQQQNGKQEQSKDNSSQRSNDRQSPSEEQNQDKSDDARSEEDRDESSRRSEEDRSEESRENGQPSQGRRQQAERREEQDEKKEEKEQSEQTGTRSPSGSQSQKPNSPPFQLPQVSFTGGIFGFLKFLLFVVLGCLGAWWLWKNWATVMAGLRQLIQELRDLWAALFGGKPKAGEEEGEEAKPKTRPERPFADYVDPFASGVAARYAPDELVRYTFEATEAWARENGCRREPDQTPHEFAARLGGHVESLRPGAVALAKLYCQAAYAPGSLASESLAPLADFWRRLHASHRTAVQPPPVQTPVG